MIVPNRIHVALTFDDGYWAPAYALMRSICLFSTRRADVVFHLFHHTLAPDHRADLLRITDEFGATLAFHDVDTNDTAHSIMQRANYNHRLSNIVYARLMFEAFLPPEVERIIYLDCDMMVMRPIERLFEMDMQGRTIAAAPDFVGPLIATQGEMIDPRGLFDLGYGYFNAGMLLIDLVRWRAKGVLPLLERFIADGTLDKIYYDQDFLNLTFRDDWLELDPKWNFFADRPVLEILNPYILHYVGEAKPWHVFPRLCFASMYRHVMTHELYNRYILYRWKRNWRSAAREIARALKWWR